VENPSKMSKKFSLYFSLSATGPIMGNKSSSEKEVGTRPDSKTVPTKKKLRKFLARVSQRRSNYSEAERNKAKLASLRLNGTKPKREFYLAERVLTDAEINHIMVSSFF
jgi:hypothetical protein